MIPWSYDIINCWTRWLAESSLILITSADSKLEEEERVLTKKGQLQCKKLNQVLDPVLKLIQKNYTFLFPLFVSEILTLMSTFAISIDRLEKAPGFYSDPLKLMGYESLVKEYKKVIHCADSFTMQLALLESGGPDGVFHTPAEPLETIFVKVNSEGPIILARLSCLEGLSDPTVH